MATDVASKGLDFPAIQHVINYDMPEEIENYGGNSWGEGAGWAPGLGSGPEAVSSPRSAQNRTYRTLRKHRHRHHLHQ